MRLRGEHLAPGPFDKEIDMMRSRYLLPALLLGVGLTLMASLPSPAGESADKEKIAKLIDQLGSGAFAERQKATKELAAIGAPALEALRKAAQSEDAEVRKRASELLKKIEKEVVSTRLLAPKRIHLVYKETPVREAVADFQKKSGYNLRLHDLEGKLKARTITLDTGATTFWRAYEMFCEKAGLTEATMQDLMRPPAPAGGPPGGPAPPPQRVQPIKGAPAAPVLPAPPPPAAKKPEAAPRPAPAVAPAVARPGARIAVPFAPSGAGWLMLKDGKAEKLPTDDRCAVRVRALPKADLFGGAPEGEILLALEIWPEPRLAWQGLQSVRIDKARDDRDQTWAQVIPQTPAFPGAAGLPQQIERWVDGVKLQVPVQFKKGDKAAKSLAELKGVLTAQMLTEAKPMITADNLAKAAGKTFKGEEGGYIKILTVKAEEKRTTIQLEFEQPADTMPATPPAGVPAVGGAALPARQGIKPLPAPAVQPPAPPAAPPPPPPPPPPAAQAPAAKPQAAQVQVQIQGGIAAGAIAGPAFAGPVNGLSVQDAKGNTLPVRMGPMQFRMVQGAGGNAFVATYTLLCEPGKDQGEPAKVVYLGRKRVTVDVSFVLKNVSLP
jgi:hypothetical protein